MRDTGEPICDSDYDDAAAGDVVGRLLREDTGEGKRCFPCGGGASK